MEGKSSCQGTRVKARLEQVREEMPRPGGADWPGTCLPGRGRASWTLCVWVYSPSISVIQTWGKKSHWERNGKAERRTRERPARENQYWGGIGIIKPFNIKAGKALQNLVQPSPFMGGKASRVDTSLM